MRRALLSALPVLTLASAMTWACSDGGSVEGLLKDNTGTPLSDAKSEAPNGESTAMGKTCTSNADCKVDGLNCFLTDTELGTGICSQICKSDKDCGGLTHCNTLSGAQVCTLPRYCNPCKENADCGPAAPICVEIPGSGGPKFCSHTCSMSTSDCPAGASCVQFGTKAVDFACMPNYGACEGGGEQCSPCKVDENCQLGLVCFQASDDAERFCATVCELGGKTECPTGTLCTAHNDKAYCLKIIGKDAQGQPKTFPTCAKGDKRYCDACSADYECASKRCVTKNNDKFCAETKPCTKKTEAEDCPYGGKATFCVDSNKGMICAPPLAHHCHGFKSCFHALCGPNDLCDNGICKPKAP